MKTSPFLVALFALCAACTSRSSSDVDEGSAAEPPAEGSAETPEEAPASAETAEEIPGGEDAAKRRTQYGLHSQPCSIALEYDTPPRDNACFPVYYVRLAGQPIQLCTSQIDRPLEYDSQRRLTRDGDVTYAYAEDGTVTVSGLSAEPLAATMNDEGWLTSLGETTYAYDTFGRITSETAGPHTLTYAYAEDGTFTTDHTYPDSDEFCVADRLTVAGDPLRPESARYGNCEINEPARIVHPEYDESGRTTRITVDLHSDGAKDVTFVFSYLCHEA